MNRRIWIGGWGLVIIPIIVVLACARDARAGAPVAEEELAAMGTMDIKFPMILGAMDRTIIELVVERHREELLSCYTDALEDQPGLAGSITLEFQISAIGVVSHILVEELELGDATVAACLLATMPTIQFPSGKGGGIMIVRMQLCFAPMSNVAPGAPDLSAVIRAHQPRFRSCYEEALEVNPGMQGLCEVHFVIDPDGSVRSFDCGARDVEPALEDCLREVFLKMIFTPPPGGGVIEVSYPL